MDTSQRLRMGRWCIKRERKRPNPTWFDRTGKQIGALGDSRSTALWSFLRRQAGLRERSITTGKDIWLYDVARGLRTRFTFGPAIAGRSGHPMAAASFSLPPEGSFDLYQKPSSGAGSEEVLVEDNLDKYPDSWSPTADLFSTKAWLSSGQRIVCLAADRRSQLPFSAHSAKARDNFSGRPMGRIPFERVW